MVSFNQGLPNQFSASDAGGTNLHKHFVTILKLDVQVRRCFPYWLTVISSSPCAKSWFAFQGWDSFSCGSFPRRVTLWKLRQTWWELINTLQRFMLQMSNLIISNTKNQCMLSLVRKKGRGSFLGDTYPLLKVLISLGPAWSLSGHRNLTTSQVSVHVALWCHCHC